MVVGITLWALVNTLHEATLTVEVPLCFFNLEDTVVVSAPEKVQITLAGRRADLRALDIKSLAAHVDASKLIRRRGVILNQKHLLLPRSIKLVSYNPINLTVSAEKKASVEKEKVVLAPEISGTMAGESTRG
ncbi:TPA: hypothetical protein DDZ86_02885 [Candidatus Dependentiae bacterium]|nr:hypothetical protein [Candidatus Dependentiae bacterium]